MRKKPLNFYQLKLYAERVGAKVETKDGSNIELSFRDKFLSGLSIKEAVEIINKNLDTGKLF